MVDLANYRCRCGDQVSLMLGKCPRCGSPRFGQPPEPVKGTMFLGDMPIGEVTVAYEFEIKPGPINLTSIPPGQCIFKGRRRLRKR